MNTKKQPAAECHPAVVLALAGLWSVLRAVEELDADRTARVNPAHGALCDCPRCSAGHVRAILAESLKQIEEAAGSVAFQIVHPGRLRRLWESGATRCSPHAPRHRHDGRDGGDAT